MSSRCLIFRQGESFYYMMWHDMYFIYNIMYKHIFVCRLVSPIRVYIFSLWGGGGGTLSCN